MKKFIIKTYSRLIASFLGLIGYATGCIPGNGGTMAEYGVPSADFILNGNVKSTTTTQVITNIQVVMGYDTVQTDVNGNFTVKMIDFPMEQTYKVSFKDIDGVANGSFSGKEINFTFPNEFEGGNDYWYEGKNIQTLNTKLDDAATK